MSIYLSTLYFYKSRNLRQWLVDCQWFNIFLPSYFLKEPLSVNDSIPAREIDSQVGSLAGSLMGQEGMLQSCSAVLQPVWTRLLLLLQVQNRAPSCSCPGAAPWDLPEVLVAQQGNSVPRSSHSDTALPCSW